MSNADYPAQRNSGQLRLPFLRDEYSLRSCLTKMLGSDIGLTLTDNRTSMLSIKKGAERPSFRIHRIFLDADEAVIQAVADFIKGRKSARPTIQAFIRRHGCSLESRPARRLPLRTDGIWHCLATLFHSVNADYFQGEITASITWGRRISGKRSHRITLGSYCRDSNTIRINPLLDRKAVPAFFLEFVIYHEMLHAVLGIMVKNGRRSVHSKEFRRREELFADYKQAVLWEREHLVR
jgi:SprT-like family